MVCCVPVGGVAVACVKTNCCGIMKKNADTLFESGGSDRGSEYSGSDHGSEPGTKS